MKRTWRPGGRAILAVLFVLMLAVSSVGAAVPDDLNTAGVDDPNTAPNPYLRDSSFTKAQHPMTEGATHDAMAGIYDDNGDWVEPADSIYVVNTTSDIDSGDNVNPYSFMPGHIADDSFTEFPDKADRTWTNASRWVKGGTNSSQLTVENTTADQGVDAVHFSTTSMESATSDDAHANYSAWDGELDTDESKRWLVGSLDVDSLEGATNVTIRVFDESDDYKQVTLNQSKTALSGNNFAASTGDSKFFQYKLDNLATTGGGTWDNIEKVQVLIEGGDADVTLSVLDVRRKSRLELGQKKATTDDNGNDDDSDGDYDETQTIYNATDSISVYSMETLDSEFDDATINDVGYPVHIPASQLQAEGEEDDYAKYWEDADDFPNFQHVLNVSYRLEAISYIDATYGTLDLMMMQKWPESRYVTLEIEEGASGSNHSDISGTSKLTSLGAKGSELDDAFKLDDSGQSDTEYLVHFVMTFTTDERNDDVEAQGATTTTTEAAGGGAAAAAGGGGAGGLLGFGLAGDIAAAIGIVGSFLAGIPQRIWRWITPGA